MLAGVTALLVAHRPTTLVLADRVALLEGGRIAEIGTHAQLIRRSNLYRTLLGGNEAEGVGEFPQLTRQV